MRRETESERDRKRGREEEGRDDKEHCRRERENKRSMSGATRHEDSNSKNQKESQRIMEGRGIVKERRDNEGKKG